MRAWAVLAATVVASGCWAPVPDAPWHLLDPEQLPLWPQTTDAEEAPPPAELEHVPAYCAGVPGGSGASTPRPELAGSFRFGGRGPLPGMMWVTDQQRPDDAAFKGPCGDGSVRLQDLAHPDRSVVMHQEYCLHGSPVVHGRFAIGTQISSASCDASWQVVTLGSTPSARRYGDRAVSEVGAPLDEFQWIEGAAPIVWFVSTQPGAERNLRGLDLERLELFTIYAHVSAAVADEWGRLFVTGRLENGRRRLSTPNAADVFVTSEPAAVFDGTLVLRSGEVRDTTTGALRYVVTGDRFLLTGESLVTTGPCGTGCERVRVYRRDDGALLYSHDVPVNGRPLALVTDRDTVLLVEEGSSVEAAQFTAQAKLRVHEVGPDGATLVAVHPLDWMLTLEQAVLEDGLLVLKTTRLDDGRNVLVTVPLPGIRPPRTGWLYPAGNAAGTWAPEKG